MSKTTNVVKNTQKIIIRIALLIGMGVLAFGVGVSLGSRQYQLQNSTNGSSSEPSYSQSNTDSPKSPIKPH
jgi:hypothetical protein